MQKYRFLEHTADALFQAYGNKLEEVFENSAEAMCSVMYEIEKVEAKESVEIKAEGETQEELLHNFLESVLVEMELGEMVFSEFRILELDERKGFVIVELKGEKMDSKKHGLKTEIKAVTWHEFFVRKEGNKWVSQVLVDI